MAKIRLKNRIFLKSHIRTNWSIWKLFQFREKIQFSCNVWFKNMVNQVPPGEPQGFTFNFWWCGVFHRFFLEMRGFSHLSSLRVGTFHQLVSPGVGISQKKWKKSENPRGGPGLPYIWITHYIWQRLQLGGSICTLPNSTPLSMAVE